MANKSLLTTLAKGVQVDQTYWSPTTYISGYNTPLVQIYGFLSAVDPWINVNDPPVPTQDQKSLKQIYKNMFVAKKITSNDISPVIQRINWESGMTYEYYRDDVDLTQLNENGTLIYNFYVMNNYYQVFKCLWNNKYGPSTVEPYFEPGTYGSNKIFKGSDGYKWKYMFTVDTGLRVRFMDDKWIPVKTKKTFPSALDNTSGSGSIDVINVINGGSGYDSANAPIFVVISGDGTASNGTPFTTATASVLVQGGAITDIIMTDTGKNYTYANASIVSSLGSGCVLSANTVSPIGGHGVDPISELACQHVMMTIEFNGSENNVIPTDISYYQLGLIVNPTSQSNYPEISNSAIYRTSTVISVFSGFGQYSKNEYVWQGPTSDYNSAINNSTFMGKVLTFDSVTNTLYLINIKGTPTVYQTLYGQSGTARTLSTVSNPDYVPQSGYITYVENRSGVQRSPDGIEQFRVVLGY